MRLHVKSQILVLLFVNAITLNACNSATKSESTSASNSSIKVEQSNETTQETAKASDSKVQLELDKAKKAGKAAFIVVTGANSINTDKAKNIAKSANEIYKNAVIVELNRDDAANASLVAEWRLSGAPLPLILVLSSKGLPTGGYPLEQATAENIAALVPTPKLEQVYSAIASGKHAIIVFTKKPFADKKEVIAIGKDAVSKLNGEAVYVEVDMDDIKETGFMNQLRINNQTTTASITVVINKQGQVAGTSTAVPDAAKLIAAAKAPVKSGCGSGCGPAGCAK